MKVTLNAGTIINLEMQNWNEGNWKNRSLSYLCRNFDRLQRGEDYNSVSPVIHIGFLGYDLSPKSPEFYASYKLLNIKTHRVYNDKFTLNVLSFNQIELATDEDKKWEIDKWARLFNAATYEEVKMLAKQSEAFSDAAEQMVLINSNEIERERLIRRQEAINHEIYVKNKLDSLNTTIREQDTTIKEQDLTIKNQNDIINKLESEIKRLRSGK